MKTAIGKVREHDFIVLVFSVIFLVILVVQPDSILADYIVPPAEKALHNGKRILAEIRSNDRSTRMAAYDRSATVLYALYENDSCAQGFGLLEIATEIREYLRRKLLDAKAPSEKEEALIAWLQLNRLGGKGGLYQRDVLAAFRSKNPVLVKLAIPQLAATVENQKTLTQELIQAARHPEYQEEILHLLYTILSQKGFPWGDRPTAQVLAFAESLSESPNIYVRHSAHELIYLKLH